MKRGDSVLILCEVYDADEDSYTMMVNAVVYRHGKAVVDITECGVLIRGSRA